MSERSERRALVTGASGYLGSHLVRALQRQGWQVHAITRLGSSPITFASGLPAPSVHVHDGTTEGMLAIAEAARPDVTFHLASLFLADHRPDQLSRLIESNVLFGAQLLEAVSAHGGRRLVSAGTSWQHFENAPYNPVCLYAATKQAFEDLARYYVEARSLRVISLHLGDTYGPDDPRAKVLNLLATSAREGTALGMSPGEQELDLVHVDDVVSAFVVAADRLLSGADDRLETFALTAGERVTLRQLVDLFQKATGARLNVSFGARPYRPREMMKAPDGPRLPGWKPAFTLLEGLARAFKR